MATKTSGNIYRIQPSGCYGNQTWHTELLPRFPPTLYTTGSVTNVSLSRSEDNRTTRKRMVDVGLTKIIGDGAEHPGIGSSKTPTIRSLCDSFRTTSMRIGTKDLPKQTLTHLAKGDPCELNKTKEK
jgi:hypothetical protein